MKKILLLVLMISSAVSLFADPPFDALSFTGGTGARRGEKLEFSFDKKMSPLKNENNIDIVIYQYNGKSFKVKEPVLKKSGSVYSGTVIPDADATLIAFSIANGEIKDNFGGKGYFVQVTGADNKPVKGSYLSLSQLYSGQGERLYDVQKNAVKAMAILDEGLKAYPELKDDATFTAGYLSALYALNTPESKASVTEKLDAIAMRNDLKETEYAMLAAWYGRLKMKEKADAQTVAMKQKYPAGTWVTNDMTNRFFREKDTAKKIAIYDSLLVALPADKLDDATKNQFKSQIANAFVAEKNMAAFSKWAAELPQAMRSSLYNNVSWNMAEAGDNMAEAKRMSEEATMWAKSQVTVSTEKQPEFYTAKQWEEQRKGSYAMFADTYAFILYNMGDYKAGLPFAKDGATINKLNDAEYNERYAMLLEKAAPAAEAKKVIEEMVQAGKASPKTKEVLKGLYVKGKGSDAGFDAYFAALEEATNLKRKEAIAKSMINIASPKFALKDWEGKEVSLESLKGKIVVVDFWATWCGPCIASMPGMKKAQEALSSRDDVKFLFIDTWENVDNKTENSKDFMKKKNYPFYVLMDNEDKMVKDFDVSGIPTKFIIDKSGRIRFKEVGFEGNTDMLADGVMTMVEMAGK